MFCAKTELTALKSRRKFWYMWEFCPLDQNSDLGICPKWPAEPDCSARNSVILVTQRK